MIFIDTSVWIEYFKAKESPVQRVLHELLDQDQVALPSLVWLEILSGARKSEMAKLKRVLSALPRFYPDEATWKKVEEWIEVGLNNGQRFGVADLLIAAIATEHKAKLWTLDSDFKRMAKLGFLELQP